MLSFIIHINKLLLTKARLDKRKKAFDAGQTVGFWRGFLAKGFRAHTIFLQKTRSSFLSAQQHH